MINATKTLAFSLTYILTSVLEPAMRFLLVPMIHSINHDAGCIQILEVAYIDSFASIGQRFDQLGTLCALDGCFGLYGPHYFVITEEEKSLLYNTNNN